MKLIDQKYPGLMYSAAEANIIDLHDRVLSTRNAYYITQHHAQNALGEWQSLQAKANELLIKLEAQKAQGRQAAFELMLHSSHWRFMKFVTELEKSAVR